ncbi:MAG: hypothetical protein KKC26_08310, partial [Nanoarchaeota archaeon]|nr:hypothetical protein [Nanoarchaeota archaeon]
KKIFQKKEFVWMLIIFVLLTSIFLYPIIKNAALGGKFTMQFYQFLEEAPRKTILQYHQIPLWNPYQCGGNVLLASPQSGFLFPLFVIIIIFNTIIGMKLLMFAHYLIGLVGMYLVGKHFKMKPLFAFFAACIYTFTGVHAIYVDMTPKLAFFLLPILFFCFVKSIDNKKYLFLAALIYSLVWFDKGVYALAYISLFLIIFTLISYFKKDQQVLIKQLFIMFILFFLISSIKTIPYITGVYLENQRPVISGWEQIEIQEALRLMIKPTNLVKQENTNPVNYQAYGNFIGLPVFILFIISFFLDYKKHWNLKIASIIFFTILLGNKFITWPLLHNMPIFSSLHFPGRSRFIINFCIAILSALTLQKICFYLSNKKKYKRITYFMSVVIISLIIIQLIIFNRTFYENVFTQKINEVIPNKEFIQKSKSETVRNFENEWTSVINNEGCVYCVMAQGIKTAQKGGIWYYFHGSAIPIESPKYQGEVYLLNNTEVLSNYSNCSNSNNVSINRYMNCSHNISSTANYTYWSPNKLIVEINTTKPDTLIINQNYHEPWKSYSNKKKLIVKNTNDLISVEIKPENKKIMLYYLPTSFIIGSIISITTITGIIMWLRKKHN